MNSTVIDSSEKRESTIAVTAKGSRRGRDRKKPCLLETSRVGESWLGLNAAVSLRTPFTKADMIHTWKNKKKYKLKNISKREWRKTHTKRKWQKTRRRNSPYSSSSSSNSSLRTTREPESRKMNKLLNMTARKREKEWWPLSKKKPLSK